MRLFSKKLRDAVANLLAQWQKNNQPAEEAQPQTEQETETEELPKPSEDVQETSATPSVTTGQQHPDRERDILGFILQHEGYYSWVAGDKGGETYRGISRKYHPDWKGWKIVDQHKPLAHNQKINDPELDREIEDFYLRKYASPTKVADISDKLMATHLFDFAVNAGVKTSVRTLQKAINKTYDTGIKVDGILGPVTLALANSSNASTIACALVDERVAYYTAIVDRDQSQKKFLRGWLNRVEHASQFAAKL